MEGHQKELATPGEEEEVRRRSLALESREPASLARRQFACPQTIFDYEKKKKMSFWPHKTAGSLVIILQAGRLLACRQSGFSLQTV